MRSRFICPMRVTYMRSHTTKVSAAIATAGRKIALFPMSLLLKQKACIARLLWLLQAFRPASDPPSQHQLLDLGDRERRIQPLRAGPCAVHDRVAAIQLER